MHFALPPRKSSHPPPYARAAARNVSNRRKSQAQVAGLVLFSVLAFVLLVRRYLPHGSGETAVFRDEVSDVEPKIVLVTVLDNATMTADWMEKVTLNREDYARRHGYDTWFPNTSTYSSLYDSAAAPAPASWAVVPALRHALAVHPESTHLFYLTANALITNPGLSLESHILSPARLPGLMLKDIPVVPPDSVIHTFSHLAPAAIDLILSQDISNLAHTSLILRNSEWSRYLLDAWFDPLYRAYNFQKAEGHALEHLVQWHPTILAKIALVEQRVLNSYNYAAKPIRDEETGIIREKDSMWREGDLVVNFEGCAESAERSCEEEMEKYWAMWETVVARLDGDRKARSAE